jgi:hypothetical protein
MPGFLSGTVQVPGVGKLPKAAVGGGLAVVGYAIYKYRKDNAAGGPAAAAAGGDPYPPDGSTGDPSNLYSTDPATGITYGDEQLGYGAGGTGGIGAANQLDPYPWDGTTANAADPYSMDPATGTTYGNEGNFGSSNVGSQAANGPPFTSNAAWSQYAINYLTATLGLDPGTVSGAIGAYIAGRPVTAAQEATINEAIAVAGPPPVSGPNNFPPSINVSGSKTGGTAVAHNPVTGLHASVRYTQLDVSWHASEHATKYRVIINDKSGRRVQTDEVTGTHTTVHNLHKKTRYQVKVLALPTNSSGYAHEAQTSITTK